MKIMSQVCHVCHLIMILAIIIKYQEFKFFAGKYLSPFHEIFVHEISIQKCL